MQQGHSVFLTILRTFCRGKAANPKCRPCETSSSLRLAKLTVVLSAMAFFATGCGPNYRELRAQGQTAMAEKTYGAARILFKQAESKNPRKVENLHDLGACSVLLAREKFQQRNHAVAMREVDAAIDYYRRAIDVHPGHQASLEGLNVALELKGQFDQALQQAKWAARFVGPSARQFLFLAHELEERGDVDGAFLRYRQAVVVEPRNPQAHREFAQYLLRHQNEKMAVYHMQTAYRLDPSNDWVIQELTKRKALPPLVSSGRETP